MSAPRQLVVPGVIGAYDADTDWAPDGTTAVIRGDGGLIYFLESAMETSAEGEPVARVLTMRRAMEAKTREGLRGPIVSRKRVDWERVTLDACERALSERSPQSIEELFPVAQAAFDAAVRDALVAILDRVGAMESGEGVRRVSLGDGHRERPSVADALEDVWLDDDWEATVAELATLLAERFGGEWSERSIKSALARGPYASDEARPARWRRE